MEEQSINSFFKDGTHEIVDCVHYVPINKWNIDGLSLYWTKKIRDFM